MPAGNGRQRLVKVQGEGLGVGIGIIDRKPGDGRNRLLRRPLTEEHRLAEPSGSRQQGEWSPEAPVEHREQMGTAHLARGVAGGRYLEDRSGERGEVPASPPPPIARSRCRSRCDRGSACSSSARRGELDDHMAEVSRRSRPGAVLSRDGAAAFGRPRWWPADRRRGLDRTHGRPPRHRPRWPRCRCLRSPGCPCPRRPVAPCAPRVRCP